MVEVNTGSYSSHMYEYYDIIYRPKIGFKHIQTARDRFFSKKYITYMRCPGKRFVNFSLVFFYYNFYSKCLVKTAKSNNYKNIVGEKLIFYEISRKPIKLLNEATQKKAMNF